MLTSNLATAMTAVIWPTRKTLTAISFPGVSAINTTFLAMAPLVAAQSEEEEATVVTWPPTAAPALVSTTQPSSTRSTTRPNPALRSASTTLAPTATVLPATFSRPSRRATWLATGDIERRFTTHLDFNWFKIAQVLLKMYQMVLKLIFFKNSFMVNHLEILQKYQDLFG
ncbi:unnamed protein product [Lymnaea stagnalis]|uniref:Uncharacterized protein n=1 Tax=Lymnaea stagnalis TaxID=6523 RepID=A0AAV2HTU3_LYMST